MSWIAEAKSLCLSLLKFSRHLLLKCSMYVLDWESEKSTLNSYTYSWFYLFFQKFHCRKISAPSFASTLKNLNSNNSPSSDQSYPDSDAQRFQHHYHHDQAASSNVVVDSGYSPLHIKKRPKHPPPPASGDQDLVGLDFQSQTTGEVGGDRCCFSATDLSRVNWFASSRRPRPSDTSSFELYIIQYSKTKNKCFLKFFVDRGRQKYLL